MFEYSLVAGLTASGADAYLLHVTTTPSVAYIARVDDFDCGIMISASHNPYYDNGIKLIDCYGEKMPEETELYNLAELFKVFGDSTRMRILFVMFEAEVCVCDLAEALNMTQSAISHQLRILKQNKLVKSRREGKSVFYSLADDHVRTIVDQGREHIEEDL